MCDINNKLFLKSENRIIEGINFNIMFTIVESQNNKFTKIGIKTFDGEIGDEETYHDALEMQDIDYLIDRMIVGLINRIQEEKKASIRILNS